ncbi:MAG: DUF4932 domain-containing protein [Elusimicrobia bacterium]|nr:DUF4932 domain-containing protein [Elusimicrobiota bacterium]
MMLSAVLLFSWASAAAAAELRPPFDFKVDPRIELLGVIDHLAGRSPRDPGLEEYAQRVERRFGALREHPAVMLYRDMVSNRPREDICAIVLFYYSAPPALELKDRSFDVPHLEGKSENEDMQRFLWELRDFSALSDFMGFYRDNGEFYRRLEDSARSTLGGVDPIGAIEGYLGVGLKSRTHYVLPLLLADEQSYVVPYPDPVVLAGSGTSAFEVETMAREFILARPGAAPAPFSNMVWYEPLYVFIDPSFYYFERLNIADPAAFYGPAVERCRAYNPTCTKSYLVSAIVKHLNKKAAPGLKRYEEDDSSDKLFARYARALSDRLDEYDLHRDLYPTLWDFYPRLFSVFHELAFPGAPPVKLSVPADLPIRSAADFFKSSVRDRLLGARPLR